MTDATAKTDDAWTVQKILQWTTDYLKEKGVESARLEAELMLAHARGCQRIHLYADIDAVVSEEQRQRMREMVRRRAQREPLAYITGTREFYGRSFIVGPGVLIPRPETEVLVDLCLNMMAADQPARVCEVGVGSGCVAVTLARQRPLAQIFGTDVSDTAIDFANRNAQAHNVADRVQLRHGSLFAGLESEYAEGIDGIVSNPPYVRADELPQLAPEVAVYEPRTALVAGADGMDVIRQLIQNAPAVLKPGGWIALELDPAQADTTADLLAQNGFQNIQTHRDQFQKDRFVTGRKPASTDSAS